MVHVVAALGFAPFGVVLQKLDLELVQAAGGLMSKENMSKNIPVSSGRDIRPLPSCSPSCTDQTDALGHRELLLPGFQRIGHPPGWFYCRRAEVLVACMK